jgi:PAS domain S-box-containing protein
MAERRDQDRGIPWIAKRLLDQAPAGVALLEGPDFTLSYVNDTYQALAPHRAMLGRPFAEVWPEAAAEVLPRLREVRLSGRPHSAADWRVDIRRRPGGPVEESYWAVTFQPIAERDHASAAIAVHVVDRTAEVLGRRRAEALQIRQERLLESERAARSAEQLAEAIPQIVWTGDPAGASDWFNGRWYDYTGLTRAASLGDGWLAMLHEHDAPRVVDRWLTALRGGTPVEVETRLRAADGTFRWHLMRVVPLRAADGAVLKWFGTATDVEEQRRGRDAAESARRREAEARRRAEEAGLAAATRAAELTAVLDSIADGLVISDLENEVRQANERALRLLGPLSEGGDWLAHVVATDETGREVPAEDLPQPRALRGEVVRGQELRLVRRDGGGRPVWLSLSAAPVRAPGGAIAGVVTTIADVTRPRELQERQSDLLRAISHDLRTPLTVILTQAQMLQRRPDDAATVARRAASVRLSAQRMASMIDDLVDLVRLEGGMIKLAPRPVALAPFAAELVERLRGAVAVERLRLALPDRLPPAWADPPRLERIVVNLITNALKYSAPETEVLLSAACGDGQLLLTVADRGPGIAADELPRVFERFYRSPSAGPKEGLGLGLYITRLLVEAHGGRITVESQAGRGSAFHVALPLAPGEVG